MKKFITTLLLTAVVSISIGKSSVKAATFTPTTQPEIIYFDNGFYLETTIENSSRIQEKIGISLFSTAKSITKSKTATMKNANGVIQWSVTIKASFTYNGLSSKCTSCSHSTTTPSNTWSIKKVSSSKSGNSATAEATATYSFGNISKDYSKAVTIQCSKNGTVS